MKKFLTLMLIIFLKCSCIYSPIAVQRYNDAVEHYNLGVAYANIGKYQEATREYKEAISIKPDFFEAHHNLGIAYANIGKYQEATRESKVAISIKPDFADAHGNLGLAYLQLDKYQEAIQELKEAIRIKPGLAEAHLNLGLAYFNLGKYQEAVQESIETIRIKPDLAEAHYNLGTAYIKLNKYQKSIPVLKEAIRIKPDLAEAHLNLGAAYFHLGKYQETVQESNEAIRIKPNLVEAHLKLGAAYFTLGKYQESIPVLNEAIRLKPDLVEAHEILGAAYLLLGKDQAIIPELAIKEFKEVIRINPDHAIAHYILGVGYDSLKDGHNAIVHILIAAKLFEKAEDKSYIVDANKKLREYYAKYGYEPDDFASTQIPGNDRKPKNVPTVPHSISLGTGILFNQSLEVFTNYHVVHGAKKIKVKFVNGETIQATVSYRDVTNDVAMLTITRQPKIQMKRIRLADTSNARIGEKVFTIGYPVSDILGKEPKYSEGVINSLTGMGDDTKMFQISVPIQAGNSGGPLFNERGEVLGLVTSTFSTNEASLLLSGVMPQNVNFAIKSSLFAEKALSQSKAIAPSSIVPIPVPFSIPDFVASVKNNVVLIEAE